MFSILAVLEIREISQEIGLGDPFYCSVKLTDWSNKELHYVPGKSF